ncbi:putative ribonuclease H-like domain-containing protein [Tanacetum coccineum]|uniref:Ribonuclease H-like domain-containing protein n=1 Tax=Tanacetum coccineum TaxID=301880 RepID=A0ABQ5A1W7_9ASTR
MTHPSPKRNMIPKAVLMRSGLASLTTATPVNIARPKVILNAVKGNQVNTARLKAVFNAVKGNQVNTARPKAVLNVVKGNQEKGVDDSGCSRHMTGNMSYLTNFEEIDGGYVAFGGIPKGENTGIVQSRTNDYSRFSWAFFLATKYETSGILKSFITRIENLIDQRVKVIRCDNRTEFKNKEMNKFCERKGIKREFSVARTPQQNGVAERKNRTLIEASRTMLVDSKLPTTFWAEAVNTACYVQWSMNYKPVVAGNQSNSNADTKACDDISKARMKTIPSKDYILLPLWTIDLPFSQCSKSSPNDGSKPSSDDGKKVDENLRKESEFNDQEKEDGVNSTNNVNTASINEVNVIGAKTSIELPDDLSTPALEDIVYSNDEDVGA